ncbi:MAG: rod shape-determining protein MreD [Actinomycetota bacterium]|nr:rod shape-determining protein MreD [Actinomycetota bacterium]
MIRVAVTGLLLFSAALLQTTVLPHLSIAGYRPDLLLLVTALFAFRDGPVTGVVLGFAAGLLNDLLLVQSALGLSAVVFTGVGYAVGVVRPYLAPASITAPLAVAFVSAIVATAGYGLLSRLLGDPHYTVALVAQASLLVGLYNTMLTPPVVAVVSALSSRFPRERVAL